MIVFFLLSSIHSLITTTINDEVIIKLLKTKAKKKKGYNFLLRATNFKKRHNLKGEKYQNITYFHRLKKWYVSPVDSRFLPPSNFSLHVNTRLLYKGPFPIVVRPQVGNASNEGEQRCIFQPAQRYDGFLIIKEKNSMSRENSLPKPFFFPSFFFFSSTYRIDMNEELSRRSIIVPMGPFSRQIKHEFYQVLLWQNDSRRSKNRW